MEWQAARHAVSVLRRLVPDERAKNLFWLHYQFPPCWNRLPEPIRIIESVFFEYTSEIFLRPVEFIAMAIILVPPRFLFKILITACFIRRVFFALSDCFIAEIIRLFTLSLLIPGFQCFCISVEWFHLFQILHSFQRTIQIVPIL